jgi:hypothetical protein
MPWRGEWRGTSGSDPKSRRLVVIAGAIRPDSPDVPDSVSGL